MGVENEQMQHDTQTMDDFADVNGMKNWQKDEFGQDILRQLGPRKK